MDTQALSAVANHPAGPVTSAEPAVPVPVAMIGRTSTYELQDPVASMRRQIRKSKQWLPEGWYLAAIYWDVESGGIDLEDRSATLSYQMFTDAGIPRDGGMAGLLAEASAPEPRFAAVVCEDIERSGRDTFNALKLERELSDRGIPLFATDEPANLQVQEVSPTTVLVRRVKQGVAEYFRLQIKQKTWEGLVEHAISGWNIGPVPYGYTALRVPHPVPVKASQGRTKTRLDLEPVRAQVVAQIYRWRVDEHLGIPTIATRLNADHAAFPPPDGQYWQPATVAAILGNPKYTGYMVYGRRRRIPGHGRRPAYRPAPPEQWVWSEQPAHPAVITRAMFDAAQVIAAAHRTAGDDPAVSAQPLARRTYPLRSRVRCRLCQRRMRGVTRHSTAYYAGDPTASYTYYQCTHDVANPRHAAAHPDHPRTVTIRQDLLENLIRQFLAERILGPERAALAAAQIPATDADAAEQHERQRQRLVTDLARIDVAQRSQILQIETLSADPADHAAAAMRERCSARFTELHTERQTVQAQLDTLEATTPQPAADLALLDDLPLAAATLGRHPGRLMAALYQAFDIQCLYKPDLHQVTMFATITTSTPGVVAAIINAAGGDPAHAGTPGPDNAGQASPPAPESPEMYPLPQRPIGRLLVHSCGRGWGSRDGRGRWCGRGRVSRWSGRLCR